MNPEKKERLSDFDTILQELHKISTKKYVIGSSTAPKTDEEDSKSSRVGGSSKQEPDITGSPVSVLDHQNTVWKRAELDSLPVQSPSPLTLPITCTTLPDSE